MNPLYQLPLHGISCLPFGNSKTQNTLHQLNLSFQPLNTPLFNRDLNSADWVMKDQGERYKTEVSIFINKAKTNENEDNLASLIPNHQKQYILQVNCQGKGQFHIHNNNIKVYWDEKGTDSAHYFQTIGLALWLELHNILCIHANALSYKGNAIALVAPSRTGKTTLTAELCKSDFELMTDDMMAIHPVNNKYMVYPSWPEARMWPETLEFVNPQNNNEKHIKVTKVHQQFAKNTVHINKENGFNFCETPKALKTIYLLNRVNSPEELQCSINQATKNLEQNPLCHISKISPAHAVILLLQNSILGSAYSVLGLENERVKQLTKLIHDIDFKLVTYVSGMQNLNIVKQKLISDLNTN